MDVKQTDFKLRDIHKVERRTLYYCGPSEDAINPIPAIPVPGRRVRVWIDPSHGGVARQ